MIKILTTRELAMVSRAMRQGRKLTCDGAAFTFRMGAGFPGDVNRSHPASIVPGLNDPTNPATVFGQPLIINGADNSWRSVLASDQGTATDIDGVLVRPYPVQQDTSSGHSGAQAFGVGGPGFGQPLDILDSGYIMVQVNGTTQKGGKVYIWAAASSGSHVLGGFEAAATGGSTFEITSDKTYYNGPPDANGVVELVFNV